MKRIIIAIILTAAAGLALPASAPAQHQHGSAAGAGMKMDTREVLVEGVMVTFQIMENSEHRKHLKSMKMKEEVEPGTTHNVTVILKDQATNKEITDATVTMKVIDPKGGDQIKALKYEGDMQSFDAFFNLPEKGKYQLLVLFKTGEQKRTAGINYEIK